MNNNLTEVTASFKEQLQSVRAHYHSLQSQYFRVNDEIHKIAEAPPSRSDLERLLIKAIDAYALFPTTKLTNVCERFTRDPQGEDDIAPVSYTHLDVYKRQRNNRPSLCRAPAGSADSR